MLRSLSVIALVLVMASLAASDEDVKKAASFTLKDIDNKQVVLDSLLGKGPIILDFWATWCKPCAVSLDHMRELHDKYKEKGLSVVAVNEDDPRNIAKVRPMAASHRWNFRILLDPNREVKRLYHVAAFPTTYVLDHEGNIKNRHVGYLPGSEKELEEEIKRLLLPEKVEPDSSAAKEEGEKKEGESR